MFASSHSGPPPTSFSRPGSGSRTGSRTASRSATPLVLSPAHHLQSSQSHHHHHDDTKESSHHVTSEEQEQEQEQTSRTYTISHAQSYIKRLEHALTIKDKETIKRSFPSSQLITSIYPNNPSKAPPHATIYIEYARLQTSYEELCVQWEKRKEQMEQDHIDKVKLCEEIARLQPFEEEMSHHIQCETEIKMRDDAIVRLQHIIQQHQSSLQQLTSQHTQSQSQHHTLQQHIQELNHVIEIQTTHIITYREREEKLIQECVTWQQRVDEITNIQQEKEQTMEQEKQEMIKIWEQEKRECKSQMESRDQRIRDLEHQHTKMTQHASQATSAHQGWEIKYAKQQQEWESRYDTLQQEWEKKYDILQTKHETCHMMERKIHEMEHHLKQHVIEIQDKESIITRLKQGWEEWKHDVEKKEDAISTLKTQHKHEMDALRTQYQQEMDELTHTHKHTINTLKQQHEEVMNVAKQSWQQDIATNIKRMESEWHEKIRIAEKRVARDWSQQMKIQATSHAKAIAELEKQYRDAERTWENENETRQITWDHQLQSIRHQHEMEMAKLRDHHELVLQQKEATVQQLQIKLTELTSSLEHEHQRYRDLTEQSHLINEHQQQQLSEKSNTLNTIQQQHHTQLQTMTTRHISDISNLQQQLQTLQVQHVSLQVEYDDMMTNYNKIEQQYHNIQQHNQTLIRDAAHATSLAKAWTAMQPNENTYTSPLTRSLSMSSSHIPPLALTAPDVSTCTSTSTSTPTPTLSVDDTSTLSKPRPSLGTAHSITTSPHIREIMSRTLGTRTSLTQQPQLPIPSHSYQSQSQPQSHLLPPIHSHPQTDAIPTSTSPPTSMQQSQQRHVSPYPIPLFTTTEVKHDTESSLDDVTPVIPTPITATSTPTSISPRAATTSTVTAPATISSSTTTTPVDVKRDPYVDNNDTAHHDDDGYDEDDFDEDDETEADGLSVTTASILKSPFVSHDHDTIPITANDENEEEDVEDENSDNFISGDSDPDAPEEKRHATLDARDLSLERMLGYDGGREYGQPMYGFNKLRMRQQAEAQERRHRR